MDYLGRLDMPGELTQILIDCWLQQCLLRIFSSLQATSTYFAFFKEILACKKAHKVLTLMRRLMVAIHKAMAEHDEANFDWPSFAAGFLNVEKAVPWGSWLEQLYLGTLRSFFHEHPLQTHGIPTMGGAQVRRSFAQKRKAPPGDQNATATKKRSKGQGEFLLMHSMQMVNINASAFTSPCLLCCSSILLYYGVSLSHASTTHWTEVQPNEIHSNPIHSIARCCDSKSRKGKWRIGVPTRPRPSY